MRGPSKSSGPTARSIGLAEVTCFGSSATIARLLELLCDRELTVVSTKTIQGECSGRSSDASGMIVLAGRSVAGCESSYLSPIVVHLRTIAPPADLSEDSSVDAEGAPIRFATHDTNWRLASALHIITARFSDPKTTLATTALELNVSPEHLCRVIRRATGSTFREYVRRLRVAKAIGLLQGTSMSIKQIADQSGFETTSNLDRAFRKNGCPVPTSYRVVHGADERKRPTNPVLSRG